MSDFLPKDYKVPTSEGGYMKLEQGENRFRIMEAPILGYELWVGGKPKRYKEEESITVEDYENSDKDSTTGEPRLPRHFWAMVVWNYQQKRLQILEITQKTIQKAINVLNRDGDWGNPVGKDGYDIVITKEGQKFETTYSVNPKPKKELEIEITKAYKDSNIKVDELYGGGNPFSKNDKKEEEDIAEVLDSM